MKAKAYTRKFLNKFVIGATKLAGIFNKKIDGVLKTKDLYYSNKKTIENTLQIFHPKNTTETMPIVFYFHGGGWMEFDKSVFRTLCKRIAEKNNVIVVNTNYRLAPAVSMEEIIEDAIKAIKFSKKYLKERFNNNFANVLFAGDSAGAHISSYLAYKNLNEKIGLENKTDLKGLILFYGVFNFKTAYTSRFKNIELFIQAALGAENPTSERMEQFSVSNKDLAGYPPCFIVSGECDKLHVSQSKQFQKILQKNNIENHYVFFDKEEKLATHGFMAFDNVKTTIVVHQKLQEFITNLQKNKE